MHLGLWTDGHTIALTSDRYDRSTYLVHRNSRRAGYVAFSTIGYGIYIDIEQIRVVVFMVEPPPAKSRPPATCL